MTPEEFHDSRKRIKDLEESYLGLKKDIDWLEKELKELRHVIADCDIHCGAIIEIERRLDKLEPLTNDHDQKIDGLENMSIELRLLALESANKSKENVVTKLPHKCPVCNGKGGVPHPLTGQIALAVCKSCEGKGIVWG